MTRNNLLLVLLASIVLASCKKDPTSRLANPLPSGSVSGTSNRFVIYDDEFKTGGGLAFIPGGENQSINVEDKGAFAGINCIRYEWNGRYVTDNSTVPAVSQHAFAGFQLLSSGDQTTNSARTGRDLSGKYQTLKFRVRGSLSQDTVLRVEGPNRVGGTADRLDLNASQLTNTWTEHSISITPLQLGNVQLFFTATFQYTQAPRVTFGGEGGVVYFDEIRYEN